jgi:hypothetical protein
MTSNMLVAVLAALCLLQVAALSVTAVTISGPVVDDYCWTTLNGRALDTGENLKLYPFKHTIHCIYEVSVCRNSGYHIVHLSAGATEYQILATLDAGGNGQLNTLVSSRRQICVFVLFIIFPFPFVTSFLGGFRSPPLICLPLFSRLFDCQSVPLPAI